MKTQTIKNAIKNNFLLNILIFIVVLAIIPGTAKFINWLSFKGSFHVTFIHAVDIFLGSVLIFIWIKKININKYFSIESAFFIGFLMAARMSLLFSDVNHHRSYLEILKLFLASIVFFVFLSSVFHEKKEKLIACFLSVFFAIAFFECAIGLIQFILQRSIGLHFMGEPSFSADIVGSATIFMSEDKRALLDRFIFSKGSYIVRAHGTFFHPNIFGGFLFISFMITLFLSYEIKKRKYKYMLFFLLFLQMLNILFTFSRAVYLVCFLATFLWIILMLIKKHDVKKLAIIIFSFAILVGSLFSKPLIERGLLFSINQSQKAEKANAGSYHIRSSLQSVAFEMIKKRPLTGIGFRNFIIKREAFSEMKNLERANVHNIFLLLASEIGLLGFCLFIGCVLMIIGKSFYNLTPFTITILCTSLGWLIIGFFDHYPISTQMGRVFLFMFLGLLNYFNKPFAYSHKASLYQ